MTNPMRVMYQPIRDRIVIGRFKTKGEYQVLTNEPIDVTDDAIKAVMSKMYYDARDTESKSTWIACDTVNGWTAKLTLEILDKDAEVKK